VPADETHQYGLSPSARISAHIRDHRNGGKAAERTAPSNLIISGRYVLGSGNFAILEKGEKGAGGEIQLTDGMKALAKSQSFHGVRFDGKTYDCGAKLGFLAANIAFASPIRYWPLCSERN